MAGTSAELSFNTNLRVPVQVTWGRVPERTSGGTLELPAGTEHRATIPRLAVDEGVKVTCTNGGLTAVWPRWGYDVAGIGSFSTPGQKGDAPGPVTVRLPVLPAGGRLAMFTSKLPAGLQWSGTEPRRLVLGEADQGIEVKLGTSPLEGEGILSLLPEVSTLDRVMVNRQDWNGVPAWEISLTLDPAAHPGETALNQIYRIAPLRTGTLVLSYKGASAAFRGRNAELQAIEQGVRFPR
jgi:hypothetical protein